jgi:hypothetical protein
MTLRTIGPCSVFGCGTPLQSRGLCSKHYKAWLRHGDPRVNKRSKPKKNPDHKPPRGPRPFQGPCSEFGCGKIATKTGRCARHNKQPEGTRPMLPPADLEHIRANQNGLTPQQLADWFRTTPSTVVAVQGGRKWGYLRS